MNHDNHYIVMFVIMIMSGFLTTMNVWVDKWDDVRFSINDVYMTLLMTGWMFLFMGIYYKEPIVLLIGIMLVVIDRRALETGTLWVPISNFLGLKTVRRILKPALCAGFKCPRV